MNDRERLYPTVKESKDMERLRKELRLDETEQAKRAGRSGALHPVALEAFQFGPNRR